MNWSRRYVSFKSNACDPVMRRGLSGALDYLFREGEYPGRQNIEPRLVLLDRKMPKVDG